MAIHEGGTARKLKAIPGGKGKDRPACPLSGSDARSRGRRATSRAAGARGQLGGPVAEALRLLKEARGARHRFRHRQERARRPEGRGHVRLDGHAGVLRASERGEPRRPRHDPAGGRHRRPVLVGRERRARQHHHLFAPLQGAADRHHLASRSALGKQADVVLELPRAKEACPHGLAPTTSTTMQLALGDSLAIALLESKGFTAHDFKISTPADRSGRSSSTSPTSCTRATAAAGARDRAMSEAS